MSYLGLGVTSGSSGEGLELCAAEFTGDDDIDVWSFKQKKVQIISYTDKWRCTLKGAHNLGGRDLLKLNIDYSHMIGAILKNFVEENNLAGIQFIGFHGHTVFHQPDDGLTFTLGDGETISAYMNAIVITNFRAKDVAVGGQGAPLMPIADKYLFHGFNIFVNFGGFCSISTSEVAYDVCPCNVLLNNLAKMHNTQLNQDLDGKVAESGKFVPSFMKRLNNLSYYKRSAPKSLCREWYESEVLPIIEDELKTHSAQDLLRTGTEHVVNQIVNAIKDHLPNNAAEPVRIENRLLMTGGGFLNKYFLRLLKEKINQESLFVSMAEPDEDTIVYKEALSFGFMGLRALLSLPNVQQHLTGAEKDTVSGSLHLPPGGVPPNLLITDQFSFSFRRRTSTSHSGSLALPSNRSSFTGGGLPGAGNSLMVNIEGVDLPVDSRASWPGLQNIRRPRS